MFRNLNDLVTPKSREDLEQFKPGNDFFVGIDSDGCVFNSMTVKHRTCFAPAFIEAFKLEPVEQEAREVWEYVNLFSRTRGTNRFIAVGLAVDLLRERTGVQLPEMHDLRDWLSRENRLGNPALEAELKVNDSRELRQVYSWSLLVNSNVETFIDNIPPFPAVPSALEKLSGFADIMIVSQTPFDAIAREWQENDIIKYADFVAAQEIGTKSEHIALGACGKYDKDRIMMLGDAPGDLRAAEENSIPFFPIIPGKEEDSWELFKSEAIDRFLSGSYRGVFENRLIDEFNNSLPDSPPWNRT